MNWRAGALCADKIARRQLTHKEADAIFFDNGSPAAAQRLCAACPVSGDCGDYAERNLIPYGVFNGEQGHARRERLGISVAGERIGSAA